MARGAPKKAVKKAAPKKAPARKSSGSTEGKGGIFPWITNEPGSACRSQLPALLPSPLWLRSGAPSPGIVCAQPTDLLRAARAVSLPQPTRRRSSSRPSTSPATRAMRGSAGASCRSRSRTCTRRATRACSARSKSLVPRVIDGEVGHYDPWRAGTRLRGRFRVPEKSWSPPRVRPRRHIS